MRSNEKTKKEVVPVDPVEQGAVPTLSADALAAMSGASHASDATKPSDMMIPYLAIVQASSDYMKRNTAAYIPDAREGDIIDTLTLKLRAAAAFIVCKFETHYTTWKPNRGQLLCQWFTDDSGYRAARWMEPGCEYGAKVDAEGNDVVPAAIYYGLLLDENQGLAQPLICSLTSTQYAKARRWNALINMEIVSPDGRPFTPPCFSRIYHMTTAPEFDGPNGNKSWAGWKIEPGPFTLAHPKFGRAWFAKAQEFRKAVEEGVVRPMPPRQSVD